MKEVRVRWVDSRSEDHWTEPDDVEPRASVITGTVHLVKETKRVVCVAAWVDSVTGQVCGVMHIPTECILSMEEISANEPT